MVVQAAIIEGLPQDLDALKKRIAELESQSTMKALEELLVQRAMANQPNALPAALEGLRRAGTSKSGTSTQ
jgi:hypothetical protein